MRAMRRAYIDFYRHSYDSYTFNLVILLQYMPTLFFGSLSKRPICYVIIAVNSETNLDRLP